MSIVLEGKDYRVGSAYINEDNVIYVTSNKFGREATKNLSKNSRGQEYYMLEAIKCLSNGGIDLEKQETLEPLFEILIQNLIFCTTRKTKVCFLILIKRKIYLVISIFIF